jgi:excisionase family DNA binding protein
MAERYRCVGDRIVTLLDDPWLTRAEAAAYLNVNPSYLEKRKRRGLLPRFSQVGKRIIRYRRSDLDAFLTSGLQDDADE